MKRLYHLLIVCALACVCVSCSEAETPPAGPANVILMIGDGMGFAQVKAYRLFADNPVTAHIELLPFEAYLSGAVVTDPAAAGSPDSECHVRHAGTCMNHNYKIIDSAAAATAYASGQDTLNERLGLSPNGKILSSIAEAGRQNGKAIGLVATSEITHATPAAFVTHVEDRDHTAIIADQLFDLQFDNEPLASVLLGGGEAALKRDDRDLIAEFKQAGYTLATDREELLRADSPRILGLFAPWGLARAWDRDENIPSLADMSRAALKALEKNDDGFFLMIEGSQIDWASHDHDVAGVISEMEDFSAAIELVLEFASERGDTLVVITADHETGGMSLGLDDVYDWIPGPLHGMDATPMAITRNFLAGRESLSRVVARHVSFSLTSEEQNYLDSFDLGDIGFPVEEIESLAAFKGINRVINQRTLTGWSTPGHTSLDVPLYAFGPGSQHFHGLIQNEELGRRLKDTFLPRD